MTFQKTAATAASLAILASAAQADTARIGAGLSLFGPTVEAQFAVSDNITVRGALAGGLSAAGTTTADGLDYSMTGSIGATSIMATYHLPAGMRVSGGMLMSNTSLSGTVSNPGGGSVGGTTVLLPFSIDATAEFANAVSPMATVGFDVPIMGMVLSTDAGIIKTGGFDVSLTESTSGGNVIAPADLATAEANIESELSQYDWMPYVSLMVGKWF